MPDWGGRGWKFERGTIQVSDASYSRWFLDTTVGTSRLEAFSDGVMAVIITITALSLKAPLSGSFSALSRRLPDYSSISSASPSSEFTGTTITTFCAVTRHISGGVMWANSTRSSGSHSSQS